MIEKDPATIFTGKPCRRGHLSPRRADNHDCLECVRLRHKAWYLANREADLARKAEWVKKNRDKQQTTYVAYYAANREKFCEKSSARHFSDREVSMAAMRQYRKDNLERLRTYDAERHAKNPHRARLAARMRRARKQGAEGSYTAADIEKIARAQRNKCAYCRCDLGKKLKHIDHIQPLSKGGQNWPNNLQLLCAPCNLSKHAASPLEFARRIGRLL